MFSEIGTLSVSLRRHPEKAKSCQDMERRSNKHKQAGTCY